jgi:FlaA1/EpsC-like NDP-sugar epimerase
MLVFLLLSTSSFVFLKTHTTAFYKNARKELAPLFVAIALSTTLYYPLMLLMGQLESFSLITPFFNLFVCVALLFGARFAVLSIRTLWENQAAPHTSSRAISPVRSLLIGDISDIHAFLTDHSSICNRFEIVAIVAKPHENFGKHINGIPIAADIKALHESHDINFMDDLDAVLTINGSNAFLPKLRRFCSIYKKSLFEISSPDQKQTIPDPNNDEFGCYQKTSF